MKKMQKAGIVMLSAGVLGGVAPAVAPSVLNLNGSVVYAEENTVSVAYHFEGVDSTTRVKVNIAENPNATVGDYYPLSKDGGDLKYITDGKTMMFVYRKSETDGSVKVDRRGDLLSKHTNLLGMYTRPNNDGNTNAGANNNTGTEVKPDSNTNAGAEVKPDSNTNAGANNNSSVTPTPVKPETKVYTEAEIEALQNKATDLEKEVAELEKLIAENENNPAAVDYVTAAKDKLEDKKAELEKKEAELEEALKVLEPKVESSNGTEAPINNVPELGNVDKLKIEAEIEQLKEQIKDGEENGAEPYYIEGLKARLAELEEALAILAANKPAVNEVPEFDLSKLPQPGVPTPGAAGSDFGQNPQGDGNSFGPKTEAKEEAKEGSLPNTGMTTSSTVALGLSLMALVGLAVRRKLNN